MKKWMTSGLLSPLLCSILESRKAKSASPSTPKQDRIDIMRILPSDDMSNESYPLRKGRAIRHP